MYGRYRESMEPNYYRVQPPWAIDYTSRTNTRANNHRSAPTNPSNAIHGRTNNSTTTYSSNNIAPARHNAPQPSTALSGTHFAARGSSGADPRAGSNPGSRGGGAAAGSGPASRASGIGGDVRPKPGSTYRYGGRQNPKPYDRDLGYWLNFRPYSAPYGTNSHRGRERSRREGRIWDDRNRMREEEERALVPLQRLMARNVLTVTSVNLHLTENTQKHHTSDYECTERRSDPRLVVRRGFPFFVTFNFQRPWNTEDGDLFLEFSVGEKPTLQNETLEKFSLSIDGSSNAKSEGSWRAKIVKQDGPKLTVAVYIAPDAIVGEWECRLSTQALDKENGAQMDVYTFTGIPDIYVLFNPWCEEDQVYYTDNPSDLGEYILNEYGCVFNGMTGYIGRKSWYYGHFQEGILSICMTLMRLAFDTDVTRAMSDPVLVARKLSRIINNSGKDPGLLTGNWSGDYTGGTSPSTWHSSVQILEEYASTERAVNYGQCWVFSQVLTTVCRALGLPCRSLTNYDSAHDTDKTMTIDSYQDAAGEPLPEYKSDSVWNFHCWNDVWINRPDLDTTSSSRGRYSGWHALDSTPQERSEGLYQCGPSPHLAIRSGEVSIGHDTGFIFAEVNGEVCTWALPKHGSSRDLKLVSRDPEAIGHSISTKLPDGEPARGTFNPGAREVREKRLDITHLYKHKEGSPEERAAVQLAVGRGLGSKIFETPGGVSVAIAEPGSVMVGSDFLFSATFTNTSSDSRVLDVALGVFPIDYRGARIGFDKVAALKADGVRLFAGQSQRFDLPVTEKMYLKLCDSSLSMNLRASAAIEGEDKPVTKMVKTVLAVPPLRVERPGSAGPVRRDQPFTVTLVINNPIKRPVTGCKLQMTGSVAPLDNQGFTKGYGSYSKKIRDIFPDQTTMMHVECQAHSQPRLNNTRQVEISLTTDQLPEMEGELTFSLS